MKTSNCLFCNKGPRDGVSLFRVNPKGVVPAVWACAKHMKNTDSVIDPEVKKLTDILEGT